MGLPGDAMGPVLMRLAWLLRALLRKQEENKGIFTPGGKQNPCCGVY